MSEIILKVSSVSVDYKSNNSFLFPWEKTKTFRAVEDINFDNGFVTAPTKPGLGYEIDWDLLKKGQTATLE